MQNTSSFENPASVSAVASQRENEEKVLKQINICQLLISSVESDMANINPYNSDPNFMTLRYDQHLEVLNAKLTQLRRLSQEFWLDGHHLLPELKRIVLVLSQLV